MNNAIYLMSKVLCLLRRLMQNTHAHTQTKCAPQNARIWETMAQSSLPEPYRAIEVVVLMSAFEYFKLS